MKHIFFAVAFTSGVFFNSASMASCSWTTLTNGTPADARAVMDNLDCLAPLASPSFTGNVTVAGSGGGPNGQMNIYDASVYFGRGSTRAQVFGAAGIDLMTSNVSNYDIKFWINGSEKARVGTDGSLLVGTTANGGWNSNAKFEAEQMGPGSAVSGYASYSGSIALRGRVNDTSSYLAFFNYGGSDVGSITSNGTSVSYNATSDERLKDWHIKQNNYERTIRHLWVGDFNWKSTGKSDFGIRAQQAYPVFPAAIHRPSNHSQLWQADYSKLAPLALWGVKDIYEKRDSELGRVAELEAKVKQQDRIIAELQKANAAFEAKFEKLDREVAKASTLVAVRR